MRLVRQCFTFFCPNPSLVAVKYVTRPTATVRSVVKNALTGFSINHSYTSASVSIFVSSWGGTGWLLCYVCEQYVRSLRYMFNKGGANRFSETISRYTRILETPYGAYGGSHAMKAFTKKKFEKSRLDFGFGGGGDRPAKKEFIRVFFVVTAGVPTQGDEQPLHRCCMSCRRLILQRPSSFPRRPVYTYQSQSPPC